MERKPGSEAEAWGVRRGGKGGSGKWAEATGCCGAVGVPGRVCDLQGLGSPWPPQLEGCQIESDPEEEIRVG